MMALYHDAAGWLVGFADYDGAARHIRTTVTDEPITSDDDRPTWEFVEYLLRGMGHQRDCVLMYEAKRYRKRIDHYPSLERTLDLMLGDRE